MAVTGKKLKPVSEICALITMAAIKNQDRVGLILFSDRIEQIVAPSKGRSHALRIMDALINFEPQHTGTDFVEAIGGFAHLARKHSVVFVVSDFLTDNYAAELQSLAFRHDVNAIHIADLSLQRSALHGLVHMHDSESGEQKVIDLKANSEPSHYQSLRQQMLESAVNLPRFRNRWQLRRSARQFLPSTPTSSRGRNRWLRHAALFHISLANTGTHSVRCFI